MKKYEKISLELKKEIENNYHEYEKLPSETELSKKFQVTRMTIRQAIQVLIEQNIIEKKINKGNYVKGQKIKSFSDGLLGFSESLRSKNLVPSTKIINFDIITAPNEVKEVLELPSHNKIYLIERLRLGDDQVFVYEIDYLPIENTINFQEQDALSLFEYLEKKCNIQIMYGTETIEAVACDDKRSINLEIELNSPLLYVKSINYNETDKPIFISHAYYRSEYYSFTNKVVRKR